MQKFRKTVSLSYVMAEDPDMGTRIIVFRALCCIEKSLLTEMIRSDYDFFYLFRASSTAIATIAPTMGAGKKQIIS